MSWFWWGTGEGSGSPSLDRWVVAAEPNLHLPSSPFRRFSEGSEKVLRCCLEVLLQLRCDSFSRLSGPRLQDLAEAAGVGLETERHAILAASASPPAAPARGGAPGAALRLHWERNSQLFVTRVTHQL